jgi:hypothetical protein
MMNGIVMRSHGRVVTRLAFSSLLALGLGIGHGSHPAAADDDLRAPQFQTLGLDGTEAILTFTDNTDRESGFHITLWDKASNVFVIDEVVLAGSPGSRRTVTRQVSGIPPGVRLCGWLFAWEESGEGPAYRYSESKASNEVCSDPGPGTASDVAAENIRGNVEPQASQSPAYLVAIRNAGASDATDVVVDVSTSGMATLGDQTGVLGGWSSNGFNCVPGGPSGGETAALHCTGGKLKAGEATSPAVIVKFTGPGAGTIHASISEGGDANNGNNGTALDVRAS